MRRFILSIAVLAYVCQSVNADEPKKVQPEPIPAPKVKVEPSIIIMSYAPRTDTMEVWQHYGVNRQGRFVPRVIVLPYGAYYSRDLQPYPWVQTRPTAVLPLKVN